MRLRRASAARSFMRRTSESARLLRGLFSHLFACSGKEVSKNHRLGLRAQSMSMAQRDFPAPPLPIVQNVRSTLRGRSASDRPSHVQFISSLFGKNVCARKRVILSVTYCGIFALKECDRYTYTLFGGDFVTCLTQASYSGGSTLIIPSPPRA